MYTIHTTDAYILSVTPRKESDFLLVCISDEFGLMYINVQGARKEESKHRFLTQPYTFARVTCVEGKVGWRLTGISEIERITSDSTILPLFIRIGALVNKLVHGEEKSSLYSIIFESWKYLSSQDLTESDTELIERIIVVRILHALGYIGESSITEPCLTEACFAPAVIAHVEANRKPITSIINVSLRASGLS